MDYQNAEFYKLNKNNPDLVYNFADELITYRKETDENGNLQIVEYRKKNEGSGRKTSTRRVLPSFEMSIEDFDAWKARLTEEALEYRRHDDLITRRNVSIENLIETDLVCEESVEDEYIREEEERQTYEKQMREAKELLSKLTPIQRDRYYKYAALGKTPTEIAEEDGVAQPSVFESIERAKAKIEKLKNK